MNMGIAKRLDRALYDHENENQTFDNSKKIIIIHTLLFEELAKEDVNRIFIRTKSRWRMNKGVPSEANVGTAYEETVYYFKNTRLFVSDKILPKEFTIID